MRRSYLVDHGIEGHAAFFDERRPRCAANLSGGDGASIRGLLTGSGAPPERTHYWHYPHYSNQGGRPGSAVRRGRYKLIEHFEDGRVELFDLSEDLSEQRDLAGQLPQVAKELRADLRRWRAEVKAGMPTVNGQYDPERETATAAGGGH